MASHASMLGFATLQFDGCNSNVSLQVGTASETISVRAEPEANPLKDWIDSLLAMKDRVPADVLVLPAHRKDTT